MRRVATRLAWERPLGASAAAAAVAIQSLWLWLRHPSSIYDADLLSYLVYFRGWRAGGAASFGYTVPKVLPVLALGPLGTPERAFVATVAVAAAGGAFCYLIARDGFGRPAGALAALLYLLDPLRSVLTLRSSADLYAGVALLGAILALRHRAVGRAGLAILLAALAKPVAAACAAAILLVPGVPVRRRALAAGLALAALPAVVWLEAALRGVGGLALPDEHLRFVAVAAAPARSASGWLEVIAGEWFLGLLFHRTWPLVLLGVALYAWSSLTGRLGEADQRAWLLLVPGLLAAAYLGLAALRPFVVFTRFFWLPSLALSIALVYGAVDLGRRLPGRGVAGAALVALAIIAALADRRDDAAWRARLMIEPFEAHARLAGRAAEAIADASRCPGPAVVPLAYLPLAAWRAPGKLERGELCAAEDWADGRGCAQPDCVLWVPAAPTTVRAREAVARLVRAALPTEIADEHGALFRARRG